MFRLFSALCWFGLLALLVSGCSSVTDTYGQKNPRWEGPALQKVMVVGDFENLIQRRYAEGQMCEYIADYSSTECLQSLDYIFAGGDESRQIAAALNKKSIDGLIYLSTQDSGTHLVSSPRVFTTVSWSPGLITTIGSGGTKAENWAHYAVKVYIPSGMIVWYGNVNADDDDPDEMIEDSSEITARKLVEANVIEVGKNS